MCRHKIEGDYPSTTGKYMRILSLFDGISCARVALERAGIPVDVYYASEIDKNAIAVAQRNYPDTIQIGDVSQIDGCHIGIVSKGIDLLIGGSPCQDLSIAKKNRKGLDGERSGLFWHFVRIKNEVQPKFFILENVASMSKESKDIISKALGVEPIMIDAALVSAQRRKRLFWTNIPNVGLPEDRGILLKDILQQNVEEKYFINEPITQWRKIRNVSGEKSRTLTSSMWKGAQADGMTNVIVKVGEIGNGGQGERVYHRNGKSVTLSALGGWRGAKTGLYLMKDERIRRLTPIECERLQSLPDNWTEGISDTKRYRCLGNAFNVEVVAHILKGLSN